ncbi:NAD(P)-dependent oxidoreductase [Candidatus Thioglobus sp.]|nr:NAD(P)-dependent oxidoreductase [Candidatus Thioglobus sp.]
MRILITGASGFIGLPLTQRLLREGHQILALSRTKIKVEKSINWIISDLSSPTTYMDEVKSFKPEVLIHLAWQDIPDFSFNKSISNLNQSLTFLSYVISLGYCKKILVSGSCFELNKLTGECLESEKGSPKDNFTWSKHSLRLWLEIECKKQGITLGWMRIFYVYGPRQRSSSLVPTILINLKNGKLPQIRTPNNSNDFLFIEDVVDAFSNATMFDFPSGIYNLGSGITTSILDICKIAEMMIQGTDTLSQKLKNDSIDTSEVVNFWASNFRTKKYLEWSPSVSLEEGIKKTWLWINNLK